MVDEAPWVDRPAALLAKPVLERRERTDPPREHDPHTPGYRGNVQPCDARRSRDESATKNDEQHKRDVDDDGGVGEDAEGHWVRWCEVTCARARDDRRRGSSRRSANSSFCLGLVARNQSAPAMRR